MIFCLQILFMLVFASCPERIIPNNFWGLVFWLWMGLLALSAFIGETKQRNEKNELIEYRQKERIYVLTELQKVLSKEEYFKVVCKAYNIKNYNITEIEEIYMNNGKVHIKMKGVVENDLNNDEDIYEKEQDQYSQDQYSQEEYSQEEYL